VYVCAGEDIDRWDVVAIFDSLVAKSLVAMDLAGSEYRYRLLESLRDYAREKLAESGKRKNVLNRHAAYYRRLAERVDAEYRASAPHAWAAAMEAEVDNVRAALEWTLGSDGDGDVAVGASLAGYGLRYYDLARSESVRWAQIALEKLEPGTRPAIEAQLHLDLARSLALLPAQTLAHAEAALHGYRSMDDKRQLIEALEVLVITQAFYMPERRALSESLAREALAISRELADPRPIASSLRALSNALPMEDLTARRTLLLESLALCRAHDYQKLLKWVLIDLGELEFVAGDYLAAMTYARDGARAAEASDHTRARMIAGTNTAHYATMYGDWETARNAADDVLERATKTQYHELITWAVHALAAVSAGTGGYERAARLFGFCNARFGVKHSPRQAHSCEEVIYARVTEVLRAKLGDEALAALLAAGAELGERQAIAEAQAV
jgi:hypothetical protein